MSNKKPWVPVSLQVPFAPQRSHDGSGAQDASCAGNKVIRHNNELGQQMGNLEDFLRTLKLGQIEEILRIIRRCCSDGLNRDVRLIVSINSGRCWDDPVESGAIQAKYEELREALSVCTQCDFTLTFSQDWLSEIAEPHTEGYSGHVRNLVFIVGGGTPTDFLYYNNYVFSEGTGEALYRTHSAHTCITDYVPSLGDPFTCECNEDATSVYQRNKNEVSYSPTFSEVEKPALASASATFADAYDSFASNKTFFFFDPLPIPAENYDTNDWSLNFEGGTWSGSTPAGPAISEFSPYQIRIWGDSPFCAVMHRAQNEPPGQITAICYAHGAQPPFSGCGEIDGYGYSGNPASYEDLFIEGLEGWHDSTATTESLIEEMIATYGSDGDTDYGWIYAGQVNSLTFNLDTLKAMLNAVRA